MELLLYFVKQNLIIIHTCKYFSIIKVKFNCTHTRSISDLVAFYEMYQLPFIINDTCRLNI